MAEDTRDWELETKLVRGGMVRTPYGEISEALFLTQSFSYESAGAADKRFSGEEPGFIYQRFGNPTTQMFEDRLALLEGAETCKATASGMAAVHVALQGLVRAGDHIVAGRALFGSCRWILSEWMPRFGVEVTYVDATDLDAWKNAVRPNTKAFLVESPANPLLEVTAIGAVAEIAHAAGAKLVVDNVFATPVFQKPLPMGADIVVYSATKHAVKGLSEALSVEFKAYGVRVADVLPGVIDTPILPPGVAEAAPKEGMFRAIPPVEVAKAVWEAYHADKLHWYVPPELIELDKAATLTPEAVRDQMAQGGLFSAPP